MRTAIASAAGARYVGLALSRSCGLAMGDQQVAVELADILL